MASMPPINDWVCCGDTVRLPVTLGVTPNPFGKPTSLPIERNEIAGVRKAFPHARGCLRSAGSLSFPAPAGCSLLKKGVYPLGSIFQKHVASHGIVGYIVGSLERT